MGERAGAFDRGADLPLSTPGKTVTALGRLASSLPVSIRISRLITLSLACGCCEIDCLAIAAALTLSVEPFALPHRSLAKSAAAYLEATRLAQTGRERMEAREYSEPMAYARLYTAWMAGPQTRNWAHSEGLSYMR